MFLTETGPGGKYIEHGAIDNAGLSLGTLFRDAKLDQVWVNNRPLSDWRSYVPVRGDRINVFSEAGTPIQWVQAIILIITIVSSILQATVFAPKKPKMNGDKTASYGIVGFQNTTGQGTPILRAYGTNRIYPHVISSGVDVVNQRDMVGKVLYCVGACDDNGWESLSDVLINDVPADQYQGLVIHTRLGTPDQTVIPGFEDSYNVWSVNSEIPYNEETATGTPYPYTTKADDVNLIKVIFSFPSGLWRRSASGQRHEEFIEVLVEISVHGANNYLVVEPPVEHQSNNLQWWRYRESIMNAFYDGLMIDTSFANTVVNDRYWADYPDVANSNGGGPPWGRNTPGGAWRHYNEVGRDDGRIWHGELQSGNQYDLRFTVMTAGRLGKNDSHSIMIYLFNVEERVYQVAKNYPNRVLLGLTNIPAKQVPTLESLKVSVLAACQRVKDYTDPVNYVLRSTSKRCWNVAHFLSDKRIGMGYEVEESEIPIAQWGEAQDYYDELIPAQDSGTEPRDKCDWVISERRWDWEHVKQCVGEGRGVLFPSGGVWKWVVDKPGSPQLLFSEPGNIVEGSIQLEISPPDRPWNQIIAEFRDQHDQYRPAITQPINGPDYPYSSTIQEAITFDTITRESQAMRECMIMLKRQFLEKRRWTFTSPQQAIIKEPFDLDWLCERTLGDLGATTGFTGEGSTTTTVILDREVEIDGSSTYLVIVQHRDGSTAESRVVSTGAGKHISISVVSPFAKTPAAMDVYAFGVQNVDHIVTRLRDMTIDNEGRVQQIRTEYIEEVYDPDPLPAAIDRRLFPYGASLPPLPLQAASVTDQLVQTVDGTWHTVLLFNVTPMLPIHAGTTWAGGAGWSDTRGSLLDHYIERGGPSDMDAANIFVGADYYPTLNSNNYGLHRRIVQYDAASFAAWFDTPFPNAELPNNGYEIRWSKFGEFDGFKVERSQDNIQFAEFARFKGIHGQIDGGDQSGTWYFRFTPFNAASVENKRAMITKAISLAADTVAPPAPISVVGFATTLFVTVEATFALPMAYDFSGIEILVRQFVYGGVPVHKVYAVIPIVNTRMDATRENGNSGTVAIRKTVDVRNIALYPAVSWAWDVAVRAYDYSGNKSVWVQGNDFFPQKLTAEDIQS